MAIGGWRRGLALVGLGLLLAACGGTGGVVAGDRDAVADAIAVADTAPDGRADPDSGPAPADAARPDAPPGDVPADATADAAADVAPDVAADVPPDATADAPPDAAADVPPPSTEPWLVPIGAADPTFYAGPWLGETTTTRVVVSWETAADGDSVVEFGPDAGYGGRAEGPAGTLHEVAVEGLQPATLYHYRACTAATCTGDLTFATAPTPGRPFRFAVYGDTQTNFETHRQVADSITASAPVLLLHAGDAVGDGGVRESFVPEYFEPARRLLHYVPRLGAIGNHDWKDERDAANYREYNAFPVDPGVRVPELNYAFVYGDAFFLVLDDTADGGDLFFPIAGVEPPLWQWLVAQATSEPARAARWRFALFHYPPASACQEDWFNMVALRDHVLPLLRENGFQATFSGHTHEYEHHLYEGLHAFVTGGGGGDLDDDEGCQRALPELRSRRSVHHHLTVDLAAEEAVVRAVDRDGVVFDTVTLLP